ncbi:MAG: bifunctional nuclease family protein, partial [Acidimicrobiales bacterium]
MSLFDHFEGMRQVELAAVEVQLPKVHPTVYLRERDQPYRELSFPIGQPEGVALAMAWHQLDTPRPLTHELMIDALSRFGVSLAAVLIDGLEGRTYLAQLVLDRQGDMVTVACRPSDALTLAMRHPVPVPIMVEEALLPPAPVEEPSVEEPSVEELDSASPAATAAGGDGPGDDWVETQLAVEQAAAAAEARD